MSSDGLVPPQPAGGPVMPPTGSAAPQRPGTAPSSNRPVSAPAAGGMGVSMGAATIQVRLKIDDLLLYMVKNRGSDLHMSVNAKPMIRQNGDMVAIPGYPPLTGPIIKEAIYGLLNEEQKRRYEQSWELDLAYTIEGVSRFRVNVMRQRGSVGAVFRTVPSEIKPLEALGMPTALYSLSSLPRGLVLVTGPTGSGKSTTLASLIDRANRTRAAHIVTIEDPIEFVHPHRMSVVNQREIGSDTHSYTDALKHVLRQDPDIILIGELRDLETISTALTAAETGHLVFATLHTQSAQDTINRIIDVFPPEQQQQVRSQLAGTLKAVICQSLVKTSDGQGRTAAVEIMFVNTAIATMIRRDDIHQIPQALQAGGAFGMQTLNQSLADLTARGVIDRETAEEYATDLKDLDALITGRMSQRRTGAPASFGPGVNTTGLEGASL